MNALKIKKEIWKQRYLAASRSLLFTVLPPRFSPVNGSFSSTINSSACFGLSLSQSASLLASLENVRNFPLPSLPLSLSLWFLKYCADQIWSNCYKQQKFHSQRVKRMLHPKKEREKGEGVSEVALDSCQLFRLYEIGNGGKIVWRDQRKIQFVKIRLFLINLFPFLFCSVFAQKSIAGTRGVCLINAHYTILNILVRYRGLQTLYALGGLSTSDSMVR